MWNQDWFKEEDYDADELGRFPQGKSRGQVFDKPGVVKVFCQIHSHMSATVMVFDHPWFAVPDESGANAIFPWVL